MVLPARKRRLVFAGLGLVPMADLGEALQEIDHIEEPVLTRPAIDAKSSITDRAISTLQALLIARPLHAERLLRLFDGKHVAAFHGGDPAPELAGFVVGLIPLARHAKSHGERQPSLSDDGAGEKVDGRGRVHAQLANDLGELLLDRIVHVHRKRSAPPSTPSSTR